MGIDGPGGGAGRRIEGELKPRVFAVIPAGGSGTRLWPRSRRATPKHVLPLGGGGRPLLLETYLRAAQAADEVFVLTERRQASIVKAVLPDLDDDHLILEPSARGTTNAYGLAALTLSRRAPDAVMITMPADHLVGGQAKVSAAVRKLVSAAANSDCLVTVGLQPTFASPGLGYIHAIAAGPVAGTLRVKRFIEKPDAKTAQRFLRSGGYFWNLAWFGWRLDLFMDEFHKLEPARLKALEKIVTARLADKEDEAERLYNRLGVEVIDRSIMEKTSRLLLVPATFQWVDIGNFAELAEQFKRDGNGNSVEGEAVLIDVKNSVVLGERRLIAAIGLEDVIIVDTPDAVLVCPRSRAQDVKRVVEALSKDRKTRYL